MVKNYLSITRILCETLIFSLIIFILLAIASLALADNDTNSPIAPNPDLLPIMSDYNFKTPDNAEIELPTGTLYNWQSIYNTIKYPYI